MQIRRAILWFVPILDEPLEYLVAEEFELAGAGSAVGGDHPLTSPSPDHLVRRRQQIGELLAVHNRWHVWIPLLVCDLRVLVGHVNQPRPAQPAD